MPEEQVFYDIELSVDHEQGEEFAEFLRKKGHNAFVGDTSTNIVNGEWTGINPYRQIVLNKLWDEFCQ